VAKVPGVTAEIFTPDTAVQPCPRLRIEWDGAKLGFTGLELQKALLDGDPRIVIGVGRGNRGEDMQSQINILPVMMSPGDEKAAAERLYAVLSKPPRQAAAVPAGAPPAQVDGQWSAHLEFVAGSADHTLLFEQHGTDIRGTHKGFALSGDLHGFVEGESIRFRTSQKYEGSFLNYQFTGRVSGDTIQGEVTEMSTITAGEYGRARWTAQRHRYTEPIGPALNHKA
jgi:L-seryl-tRNA(Ser) seleniumtransferase